ncbi:hypothetical protein RQP46_005046 [Phenoliferia psychrophenolica]
MSAPTSTEPSPVLGAEAFPKKKGFLGRFSKSTVDLTPKAPKVKRAPIPYTAGVVKQGTNKLGYTPRVGGVMKAPGSPVSIMSEPASVDSSDISAQLPVHDIQLDATAGDLDDLRARKSARRPPTTQSRAASPAPTFNPLPTSPSLDFVVPSPSLGSYSQAQPSAESSSSTGGTSESGTLIDAWNLPTHLSQAEEEEAVFNVKKLAPVPIVEAEAAPTRPSSTLSRAKSIPRRFRSSKPTTPEPSSNPTPPALPTSLFTFPKHTGPAQVAFDSTTKNLTKTLNLSHCYVAAVNFSQLPNHIHVKLLSSSGLADPDLALDPQLHLEAMRNPTKGLRYQRSAAAIERLGFSAGMMVPIIELPKQAGGTGYVLCAFTDQPNRPFEDRDMIHMRRIAAALESWVAKVEKSKK